MRTKRAFFTVVLLMAIGAITVPLVTFNTQADSSANVRAGLTGTKAKAPVVSAAPTEVTRDSEANLAAIQETGNGKISSETLKALGIKRLPEGVSVDRATGQMARRVAKGNGQVQVLSTLPPRTGPGGSSPISAPAGPKVHGGSGPPLVGQPLA